MAHLKLIQDVKKKTHFPSCLRHHVNSLCGYLKQLLILSAQQMLKLRVWTLMKVLTLSQKESVSKQGVFRGVIILFSKIFTVTWQ